jgi:hypothetical protein
MRHGTHSESKRKQWALREQVDGGPVAQDDYDRTRRSWDSKRDCGQSLQHYRPLCHVGNRREASQHDYHAAGVVMGSNVKVTMNPNFERDINQLVRGTLHDVAAEQERMLATLRARYRGQPLEMIKPVLSREWSRLGGSITEPELSDYAQMIHDGVNIRFVVDE